MFWWEQEKRNMWRNWSYWISLWLLFFCFKPIVDFPFVLLISSFFLFKQNLLLFILFVLIETYILKWVIKIIAYYMIHYNFFSVFFLNFFFATSSRFIARDLFSGFEMFITNKGKLITCALQNKVFIWNENAENWIQVF